LTSHETDHDVTEQFFSSRRRCNEFNFFPATDLPMRARSREAQTIFFLCRSARCLFSKTWASYVRLLLLPSCTTTQTEMLSYTNQLDSARGEYSCGSPFNNIRVAPHSTFFSIYGSIDFGGFWAVRRSPTPFGPDTLLWSMRSVT